MIMMRAGSGSSGATNGRNQQPDLFDDTETTEPQAKINKGAHIRGDERDHLAGQVAERYRAGETIRMIADSLGRSGGFVRTLLTEVNVEPRAPGGYQPPSSPEPASTDKPCPFCGRPRMWRPRLQEWSRFCGSQMCISTVRICQQCGDSFEVGVGGAGTKYCSRACLQEFHSNRPARPVGVTCAWCDAPASDKRCLPQGEYVCARCKEPLRNVWGRLQMHHVPTDLRQQLLLDPECNICGTDLLTVTRLRGEDRASAHLVIDHDHDCCPGSVSCGQCVRGFLCGHCNTMLGMAIDSVETLEQAAAYLRSYQTKMIIRRRENERA